MKTLTDLLEQFLAYMGCATTSRRTLKNARFYISMFLVWLEDTCFVTRPDQLRAVHIDNYQQYLNRRQGADGLPLKPTTFNSYLWGVRKFLRHLESHGFVAAKLADRLVYVREPKLLPTSVLSHTQVKRFLRKIDTTRPEGMMHRTMFELLYSSGIRVGELAKLTLDDIDIENRMMKVTGKGAKERMTPIGKTALQYLQSYIRGIRPFLPGSRERKAVFLNRLGNPVQERTVQKLAVRYAEQADLDVKVTPHTFRRSCTTELIKSNANIYHVKDLLGHESLNTLSPYIKLMIGDLKKTHAKCHPRERDDPGP